MILLQSDYFLILIFARQLQPDSCEAFTPLAFTTQQAAGKVSSGQGLNWGSFFFSVKHLLLFADIRHIFLHCRACKASLEPEFLQQAMTRELITAAGRP